MRLGASIESRHGVDAPGYRPPNDEPDEIPENAGPPTAPGAIDALWSFVIPIFGLVIGLRCLFREQVGPGVGCLVLAAAGAATWQLLVASI